MKVSDVFLECRRITNYNNEDLNFERMSDAVECLANKGLVDAMQGYLEIPTTANRIVTLPRDVEVPVKVNVGDNPSFSRTKLYEFTMNGPGSNYTPTDWGWEDKGGVPTIIAMTVSSTLILASFNYADGGKKVYVWGRDAINNEITETLTIPSSGLATATTLSFSSVTRVIKDPTLNSVGLRQVTGNLPLSTYAPDEIEPNYRQIKLSQVGTTAHILFRRSVYRISSQDDWIPVQSRMGLYCMLRANEFYRKADPQLLQAAALLEKQAEQFVNEEQKSRNQFAEVASQTERDSAKGIGFSNRDCIIAADIYDESAEICGPIGQPKIFDRMTESIEALANKAQWDAMTAYLDIVVASGNIVTLPREVEVPIKININNSPSFSRDRLYEFTLNGPGPTMTESTDFSWMDGGNVPITATFSGAIAIKALCVSSSDISKTITLYGKDSTGKEISEVISMSNLSPVASSQSFASLSRVVKQTTVGNVTLQDSVGATLSYYYNDEVEPTYRRITLSKNAATVRIMFRKASIRISSMNDLIPLQSRAAITCMMRSFEAYRSKDGNMMQVAKMAEDKAVAMLQDEQKSRNAFSDFTAGEKHPIIGLNINNRDSIIVSDIYDDVCAIVGPIGRPSVFDKMTNAIEMLTRKGQWEGNGLEGYVDITAVDGIVTLPRYVDYVMSININNSPAKMRNKWFEFHLNGPGSDCCQSCSSWTDLGDVVTLADLSEAWLISDMQYIPDGVGDGGKEVRIYGYDTNDQWIREDGVDGFIVTTTPSSNTGTIKRIERITREVTASFSQLIARNSAHTESVVLGYYYPDETEPNYRRIKVGCGTCCLRMRYRKRQLKIESMTDPLHLRSRLAILAAVSSIEAMWGEKANPVMAEMYEKKAVEYLVAEKVSRNPGAQFSLQFDTETSMSSPEHSQY